MTPARPPCPVICIGASTGGVEALEQVLSVFGTDCPPTLVVQHILGGFSAAVATRLNRISAAEVTQAAAGMRLRRGRVLLAPCRSGHLAITGPALPRCRILDAPPRGGHRPSIDTLFESAARCRLPVIAALLTGMGRDGAEGLNAIRLGGGHTIAQDEASSTIYGMPRIAAEIGAAEWVLPLAQIGPRLLRLAAGVAGPA